MLNNLNKSFTLLLVDNAHFYKTKDGKYYTPSIYGNYFFQRYLDVFDNVLFVAKTKYVDTINHEEFIQVDTSRLIILELPWYSGLKDLFIKLPKVIKFYRTAGLSADCVIYRVCQIESYFSFFLLQKKIPIYLEVVNDPSTFENLSSPLKSLNIFILKLLLAKSKGASFVTSEILQNKYIPNSKKNDSNYLTASYSSVELTEESFRSNKNYTYRENNTFKIVHMANSIFDDIKGHITVLNIAKRLIDKNLKIEVIFIGDGPFVETLKKMSQNILRNKATIIKFVGRLHEKTLIIDIFEKCDLYVYPTKLEGLPRSILEAMATGLPCLSTPIAGIPELIEDKYLFSPNDDLGFSKKIIELMNNHNELEQMSKRNIIIAEKYKKQHLDKKRFDFYSKIKSSL